jgi:hypothetical protein
MAVNVKDWQEKEFLPWKRAMEKHLDDRKRQMDSLRAHAEELQVIVGLLMEGRTRQALTAWNVLKLEPKLSDIRLDSSGDVLTLVTRDGNPIVLKLDEVAAELEKLAAAG